MIRKKKKKKNLKGEGGRKKKTQNNHPCSCKMQEGGKRFGKKGDGKKQVSAIVGRLVLFL